MKKWFLIFFILALQANAFAQRNYLLKIDALNERIKNGKDTVFIINFWATWCGPCVKELPHFEKLNNELKNEKVKVILVSVDFKSKLNSAVIPFVTKKKFRSEIFLLDEQDQQEYINRIEPAWSGAIPATIFVKENKRTFFEKEFTYKTLNDEYLKIKKS